MSPIYLPNPQIASFIGLAVAFAGSLWAVHLNELPQRENAVIFVSIWMVFISTIIAWALNSYDPNTQRERALLPASFLLLLLCSFGVLGLIPALAAVSGSFVTGLTFRPIEQPAH